MIQCFATLFSPLLDCWKIKTANSLATTKCHASFGPLLILTNSTGDASPLRI